MKFTMFFLKFDVEMMKVVGWECNVCGKMGLCMVDFGVSMDLN